MSYKACTNFSFTQIHPNLRGDRTLRIFGSQSSGLAAGPGQNSGGNEVAAWVSVDERQQSLMLWTVASLSMASLCK